MSPSAVNDPALSRTLEAIRERYHLPALGGAILDSSGVKVLSVVGVRKEGNKVAATPGDQWHLGSDSKAMTATLLAVLVEQGKLRWDSTLAEVFPEDEFKGAVATITLQQLLAHRSGLPPNADWEALAKEGTLPEQRRAAVALLAKTKLLSEPGSTFAYSNWNFVVAGAMAEHVTKLPYETLMRTYVFGPLHMESAGFGWAGTFSQVDQPWGHRADGRAIQSDNPLVMAPAGGIHCSLEDWAKFVADQLRGAERKPALLKAESYVHLQEPAAGETYVGGWRLTDRSWGGGRVFTHAGSNTLNLAMVSMAPARDVAFLIVCNQGGTDKACDEVAVALMDDWNQSGGSAVKPGSSNL